MILWLAVATVAAGLAAPAEARRAPLWLAKPVDAAYVQCSSDLNSSITNNCGNTMEYEYPLDIDGDGSFNGRVNAFGAGPWSNVGCTIIGWTDGYGAFYAPPRVYLSSFGSNQDLSIPNYFAFLGGATYLTCTVSPGGRINLVEW
jgi:hypothetical protein